MPRDAADRLPPHLVHRGLQQQRSRQAQTHTRADQGPRRRAETDVTNSARFDLADRAQARDLRRRLHLQAVTDGGFVGEYKNLDMWIACVDRDSCASRATPLPVSLRARTGFGTARAFPAADCTECRVQMRATWAVVPRSNQGPTRNGPPNRPNRSRTCEIPCTSPAVVLISSDRHAIALTDFPRAQPAVRIGLPHWPCSVRAPPSRTRNRALGGGIGLGVDGHGRKPAAHERD